MPDFLRMRKAARRDAGAAGGFPSAILGMSAAGASAWAAWFASGHLPPSALLALARSLPHAAGWTPDTVRICAAALAALPFLPPALSFLARGADLRARRRALLARHGRLESIRAMPWQDFERLCGEVYRRRGFHVTENGLGGADGGVDLVLRTRWGGVWLVQCKRWRKTRVGVREVREFYGIVAGEKARRGVFVTCGGYTAKALAFAAGKPLDLVDGEGLLGMVREAQKAGRY